MVSMYIPCRKPVVCGITNLEYDHVEVLGETLSEIAWHKAGILKVGYILNASSTKGLL